MAHLAEHLRNVYLVAITNNLRLSSRTRPDFVNRAEGKIEV